MDRPIEIAPSVLPADFSRLGDEVVALEKAGVDRIQWDVMDGRFVPNLTFGPDVIAACRPHAAIPFEAHLMVEEPDELMGRYVEAGCSLLLVHAESALLPDDLVAVAADVPESVSVEAVAVRDLPRDWRRHPAPEILGERGTEWARSGRTAVLAVPSALVPRERNFLLNPAHPEFRKIRPHAPEPFALDARLRG